MMHQLAKFIYYRIMGWKFEGTFPDLDKCVVIVAPHTSWVDFFVGLVIRRVINKKFHYVAKASLFKPPFGWYFRCMGGSPVNRTKSSDTVAAVARIFEEKEEFRLALAPEGTRKKVDQWKTGFYYIAHTAGVPVIMVAFDYGKQQVKISGPKKTSGNYNTDRPTYEEFYKGVEGKVPAYS